MKEGKGNKEKKNVSIYIYKEMYVYPNTDTYNHAATARGKGTCGQVEEGKAGINGDKKRLAWGNGHTTQMMFELYT